MLLYISQNLIFCLDFTFWVNFCIWYKKTTSFFAYRFLNILDHLLRELSFLHWMAFDFVENHLIIHIMFYFWASVLFQWPTVLSLFQYHTVINSLIIFFQYWQLNPGSFARALYYLSYTSRPAVTFKIRKSVFSTFVLLFQDWLAIWNLLRFHKNFRMDFFNLQIQCWKFDRNHIELVDPLD
jgi:hypothetical protein